MSVSIVFVTHEITEDNEAGLATGWHQGRLSAAGRENAATLATRPIVKEVGAVFSSDLARARETVEIAFAGSDLPRFYDWRLRECNYGDNNGAPSSVVHADRAANILQPHPNGESWTTAVARVKGALDDIAARFDGERVLVVGHVATRWALDRFCNGRTLSDLATADFAWQEGWEFTY